MKLGLVLGLSNREVTILVIPSGKVIKLLPKKEALYALDVKQLVALENDMSDFIYKNKE